MEKVVGVNDVGLPGAERNYDVALVAGTTPS
jgi:hypothetical protein